MGWGVRQRQKKTTNIDEKTMVQYPFLEDLQVQKLPATNFKQTTAYLLAFQLAMDIFETSKSFPKEETYSLTDQIRRSSRSVCTNLAEAFRKKQYPLHFVAKVSDSDSENSETNVWIDFCLATKYIPSSTYEDWASRNKQVGKLLNHMINNPEKY